MGLNKRLIGAGATAGAGGLTPSENFKVVTYTGDGTSSQAITGVGFKPDFVWLKNRDGTTWHNVTDSSRGVGKQLAPNATADEEYNAAFLTSFDSDGFTLGGANGYNNNGVDFVAWCWKAGEGTTSSNTDGNITSTVQANTDSGFSIATYTGSGSTTTIGHGLLSTPEMIIAKSTSDAYEWKIWHKDLSSGYQLLFNTAGQANDSSVWTTTVPTSTVFSVGTNVGVNQSTKNYIAYCFHSVEGFSKFGSYTGNGSANGPIVETGFEPAFLMIKNTSSTESGGASWLMYDNKRNTSNPRNSRLWANLDGAEYSTACYDVDFLSNGFQIAAFCSTYGMNESGDTYIYMAFAADPDTEAPTLAKSFGIKAYTGTRTPQSITGLGFKPNLLWIKQLGDTNPHGLWDSIRGAGPYLSSATSDAQLGNAGNLMGSFDTDGFSVNSNYLTYTAHDNTNKNGTNSEYIAWAWKADDNEPTIFGGPAKAVYKFEDNANDVTGSFNGTASNVTYSSSGKFNKAGDFSTSAANIAIGSPIPNTDTEVSVSAWIYLNSGATSYETVIGAGSASSGSEAPFRVNVRYVSANTYKIEGLRQIGGTYHNTALSNYTDSTIAVQTWHHIVWTYSPTGKTLTTYLNGSKVDTVELSSSGSSVNDSTSVIGNFRTNNSSDNFNGLIDQVRIYNGVVSDIGVAELYAESTSQNDDLELGGPPKSIVSANANAGFSIVNWEQIPATGTTVPHGLSAAPNMIITKATNDTDNWYVYHSAMGTGKFMYLNLANAQVSNAGGYSAVGASTFTSNLSNNSGIDMISYCFHDVAGYQKFGSYTGNGSSTGPSVTLGFQADWILIKRYDAVEDWKIIDSVRGFANTLEPNESIAEETGNNSNFTITSTGFQIGDTHGDFNANNGTYIYWAIKMN